MITSANSTGMHHILDIAAIGAAIGSFLNWMPDIAALLSAIWLAIRIGEWVVNKIKG